MFNNEIWKDASGYEGFYQVSSLGNVKSVDRYVTRIDGVVYFKKGKMMSPALSSCKYLTVTLTNDTSRKSIMVHRLVAMTFCNGYSEELFVNHIDGNKMNNMANNLEWVTRKENVLHAQNLGLIPKDAERKDSKKIAQFDKKGNLIQEFDSLKQVERIMGIPVSNLSAVANNYKHHKTAHGFVWKYIN